MWLNTIRLLSSGLTKFACINQLDNEERAQQLKIMTVISRVRHASTMTMRRAKFSYSQQPCYRRLRPDDETTLVGIDQIQRVARIATTLDNEEELSRREDVSIAKSEEPGISFTDTAR